MGSPSPTRPPPLRSDLTAQVIRRVHAAFGARRPLVVVVCGEAGAGKSTFSREVALGVGARVVTQTSVAAEASFAHVALTDLLAELRTPGPSIEQARVDDAPTVPALGLLLRDRIAAAAGDGSLVVVLDDLQWIDRDSLDVVAFAARRLRDVPVVFVVAVRTPRAAPGDRECDAAAGARRIEAVERLDVELAPVPAPRLRGLVRHTAPDLTAEDLEAVVGQAGGNPFWAVELARTGAARPGSGVDLRRTSATARERLAALDAVLTDDQRRVVAAVRLAGRPLTAELHAALAGSTDPAAAIEAAERAGLVTLVGQRWNTVHPLLGEAVLQALPTGLRIELLRRLAAAAVDPERRVRLAAEVERPPHEATASDLTEVAEWTASRGSLQSAVDLMQQAVRFTAETDERRRGERLASLASLYLRCGDFAAVLATAEPVDLDLLGPEAFDALAAALADAAALVHGRDAAQRMVARVVASADRRGDPMSRAVAAALRADRDYGSASDPFAVARDAAAVLEQASWPSPATHLVLGSLCTLGVDRGDGVDESVLDRRRRLEPALRRVGLMPASTDSADALTAYVGKQLGDPAASLSRLPALVETADRIGEEFAAFAFRVHLASAHHVCGDFAAARVVLAEAATRRGRVPPTRFPLLLPALVGQAMADESVEAAVSVLERETVPGSPGPARWQLVVAHLAGTGALERGRPAEALTHLEHALVVAEGLGIREPGRRFDVDVTLVETLLALGDLDRAAQALTALDAFCRPRGRRNIVAAVDRLTGVLSAARGELDLAEPQLLAAVDRAAALPFRLEHARTVGALAEVLVRRQELGRAGEAFAAAAAAYAAMPFAAGLDQVDRRRRELGLEGGTDALTAAERAVVDAVVGGATARQAGEKLSVSHRTVEAHLRAVYRKLGVRGRVELTSLALRGELGRSARV